MWVRHLQGWAQGGGGCCVCSLQDVEWDGMIVQHRGRGDRLLSAAAMGINGHDALDNSRPSASWSEIMLCGGHCDGPGLASVQGTQAAASLKSAAAGSAEEDGSPCRHAGRRYPLSRCLHMGIAVQLESALVLLRVILMLKRGFDT